MPSTRTPSLPIAKRARTFGYPWGRYNRRWALRKKEIVVIEQGMKVVGWGGSSLTSASFSDSTGVGRKYTFCVLWNSMSAAAKTRAPRNYDHHILMIPTASKFRVIGRLKGWLSFAAFNFGDHGFKRAFQNFLTGGPSWPSTSSGEGPAVGGRALSAPSPAPTPTKRDAWRNS